MRLYNCASWLVCSFTMATCSKRKRKMLSKIGDVTEAERRNLHYGALEETRYRNLFDHTCMYKFNLRTHKPPISSDNEDSTVAKIKYIINEVLSFHCYFTCCSSSCSLFHLHLARDVIIAVTQLGKSPLASN